MRKIQIFFAKIYLWNRCEHGSLRAVSIFSQQIAQLSEFWDKSPAVANGYVFSI